MTDNRQYNSWSRGPDFTFYPVRNTFEIDTHTAIFSIHERIQSEPVEIEFKRQPREIKCDRTMNATSL